MNIILVTGGAGFIGVNFVHYWKKHHPQDFIINLDALTYAGCRESQAEYEDQDYYYFVEGNICDEQLLEEIFTGVYECLPKPNIIVHFAAETHVDRSISNPKPFLETNVMGTGVLLETALRHGKIRFHHVSTDEVYGSLSSEDPPFTEITPYAPRSPYAASKASSDHLVRAYYETYGLPVTMSHCSNNYGPYQYPEKLLPLAITNLMQGKKVPLYGTGLNTREWLHVQDHCRALEKIILEGNMGESYCIGAEEKTNKDLIEQLLELMNLDSDMIEYVTDRPGHDWRYALSTSKIEKELQWSPQISLQDGLKQTIDWYKSNTSWWKNLLK